MKSSRSNILIVVAIVVLAYLAAGQVFRSYRMNPANQYYGFKLPGSTPTTSKSAEETEKIWEALVREPNFLEVIFEPADRILRLFF